jgi:hypothetical protein
MKEFIDEFKHLERICNELYSEQHGVTQYINEMKQQSRHASRRIPGWDEDLASLKRVRHIRNNLVHESEETVEYNSADIEFIKAFYQKIIKQQDPLALLRKQEENTTSPKTDDSSRNNSAHSVIDLYAEEEGSLITTLVWSLVVAIFILVLLFVIFVV